MVDVESERERGGSVRKILVGRSARWGFIHDQASVRSLEASEAGVQTTNDSVLLV